MSEDQNIREPSDNPVLPDPDLPTQGTEIIHTEKTDMEIHHHPHAHHKKKWTDYLFEFLMLFLAVSLGFFVENQREHYIENHRSEQYAEFLYNDLRNDTLNLSGRTAFMEKAVASVDTLMTILESFKNDSATIAKIYELSGYVYSGVFFSATTSTMQQLKNSGSLRYFRDKELVRLFSQYDTDLQRLDAVADRNAYLNEETRKFLIKFLDVKNVPRIIAISYGPDPYTITRPSVPGTRLYNTSPEQLQEFANLSATKQHDWNTRITFQRRLLVSAAKLIEALKEEYNLSR